MKRQLIWSTLIPLMAILLLALPANATLSWCKSDPVVKLRGAYVDIQAEIPFEYMPLVYGPTRYEIKTPRSVSRQLIVKGVGFKGDGEDVFFTNNLATVTNNRIPATIQVRVPIDKSKLRAGETVPVRLIVTLESLKQVIVYGTSDLTTTNLVIEDR